MPGDAPGGPDVVLGFTAAFGFDSADMTSPALAGAAGALIDTEMTEQPVTELRIRGVSRSDAPSMLEHPRALRVAGDRWAGFHRRWSPGGKGRPSVPWKLEAYAWTGLAEAPLKSASWLLLAPFMLYNVAYFMLPPAVGPGGSAMAPASERLPHLRRGAGHRVASALLRLLALAATVQFVSAAASVLLSTVAWQAAGRPDMLPVWMGWYSAWPAGWRVALALAAVAAVVAVLWMASVRTEMKYEARTSSSQPELNTAWPLTQPGFWRGAVLVSRQRDLHVAAACASAALIAALPGLAAARWVAVTFAAAVLAAAAVLTALPLADRHRVTMAQGADAQDAAGMLCRGVLAAGIAALMLSAVIVGWTNQMYGPQRGVLPGLSGFVAVSLAAQTGLLAWLALTVFALARRTRAAGGYGRVPPYLNGNLATPVAGLGFLLGGLLTAVFNLGAARVLGTPVPSGFAFATAPVSELAVAWPIYAFGAALIGLLAGSSPAALWLYYRDRRQRRQLRKPTPSGLSPVDDVYRSWMADSGGHNSDEKADRHRRKIARAWAAGLYTDDCAPLVAVAAFGAFAAFIAEFAAATFAGTPDHPGVLAGWWQGLTSASSVLSILVVVWLLIMLRLAYTDTSDRRTIGVLWDVATFWPRAVHPLAPPCYAERAVPELVDRVRLLTGHVGRGRDDVTGEQVAAGLPDLARTRGLTVPPGPVLFTGYSQGAIIAVAVIAQLPPDVLDDVALMTLGCPARRLYGRAFPAYFGSDQLGVLRHLLGANPTPRGRWKNLYRPSDPIGSWIFAEPRPRLNDDDLTNHVDQLALDPPRFVPDASPTQPPTHGHAQWWQDPRTTDVSQELVKVLSGQTTSQAGTVAG